MHKAGWKLVAHNEVLARGLAATTMPQYMLQRERWARGAMQVMKSERLLTSRALTPAQRLAYSATLFAWFDSLRSLLFVVLPIAIIFTGAIPVDTSLIVFGPIFLGTFLVQIAALRLLTRGHSPRVLSLTFDLLRMPAVIPALGELITGRGRNRQFTDFGAGLFDYCRIGKHLGAGIDVIAFFLLGGKSHRGQFLRRIEAVIGL